MDSIEITNMTLEDLDSISSILISDFDDFWTLDILSSELKSNSSYYFAAKMNEEIVGFAGIKVILDEADIMNIVTRKNFRNLGIGGLLMKKLLDLSRSLGVKRITLEVNEENFSAIHLYEKFGFKNISIRENYYNDKNGLLMQLNLDES